MATFLSFDKFNGKGFHTWQMKVKFALMRENLWGLVKPTSVSFSASNAEESSAPSRPAQDHAREEKAYGIIALALGDDYIHHISDLESPSEAWQKLDILFGASSHISKLSLKIAFFELKMTSGTPLAAHVNHMRSLMTQLASINSPITTDDAMAVLLKSMPEDYDHVVTTLKNLPNPTFEGLITALQEEERHMELRRGNDTAYAIRSQKGKFSPCKHCGKTNHLSKDCYKNNPCKICGKTNHNEKYCYARNKEQGKDKDKTISANLISVDGPLQDEDSFDDEYVS